MPRGDRTGPAGLGPMSGRGAGFCARYGIPSYASAGEGGFGGGFGGRGRRRRNQCFAVGMPGVPRGGRWAPAVWPTPQPQNEFSMLKAEAEALEQDLREIRARLAELEPAADAHHD